MKNICLECDKSFESNSSGSKAKYCSDKCRKRANRNKENIDSTDRYNADSIEVLKDDNMINDPRFDWKLCEELSHKYRLNKDWISRSVKACREAGRQPNYFINRYLEKDGTELDLRVDRASRQIQKSSVWRELTG